MHNKSPMTTKFTLADAIAIAVAAHQEQSREDDIPYIVHPMTVMASVTGEHTQMAAALHDVVEDNPKWTFERLDELGCPEPVLKALRLVTHEKPGRETDESIESHIERVNADYLEYVRKIADNPIARAVKLADLKDNLGCGTPYPPEDLWRNARIERYLSAQLILMDAEDAS